MLWVCYASCLMTNHYHLVTVSRVVKDTKHQRLDASTSPLSWRMLADARAMCAYTTCPYCLPPAMAYLFLSPIGECLKSLPAGAPEYSMEPSMSSGGTIC